MKPGLLITLTRKLLEVVLVALVTCRITDVIDWPWYVVLSPFWVPAAISAVAFAFYLVVGVIERRQEIKRIARRISRGDWP